MNLVIYGAQGVALGAYNAIKIIWPNLMIDCFLVTKRGNNAYTLGGLQVRELGEYVLCLTDAKKNDTLVLIGTPEENMGAIEGRLDTAGLHNYVRLDSIRWAKLQELAFIKNEVFVPLVAYLPGVKMPNICIFKMVHEKDKQLKLAYKDPKYVEKLQVGAAMSSVTIANLQDNTGDNISELNGDYSELTGLYWLWKNRIKSSDATHTDYYGLAHYRRFFEFSEDDLSRLEINDIDVVLPYPMPYEPDIEAHHLRYLSDTEWSAVWQALIELRPDYVEGFKKVLKQGYLYNYNVILAKSEVLDAYCSWLFPILFRVEKLANPDGDKSPNRYIGYVGETLETLYFMYNREKLKIAYTGCRVLV